MVIMAATMRNLMKLNVGLTNNIFLRKNFQNSYRFLYSESSLGLVGYKKTRMDYYNQFLNMENTFRIKMNDLCEKESGIIFIQDLKAILHLAQKNPEDIELLFKIITKFINKNKELRFDSNFGNNFIFGPVVMRTFYHLDEPELALIAFKNPQFENFFDQFGSYQILLSLLYKHEKYTDIIDVYNIIKTKYMDNHEFPRNSSILVMAACYKENTPKSFKYALNVWKELHNNRISILRKASVFLAALAINQNAPHIAIEIISFIKEFRYVDVRCLKVAAYTNLKKFLEIVPVFKLSLDNDKPNTQKETYFKDVIYDLEVAMANEKIPSDFELYKLLILLKENGYVSPETLQNHICAEITTNPFLRKRTKRNPIFQSNVEQQPNKMYKRSFRSGLEGTLY